MVWRRGVLAGYATWMALLTAVYSLLPGLRVAAWALISVSGMLAIVAGVVANRPARLTPWLLLAAANLSFGAGQLVLLLGTQVSHQILVFPVLADVCYLATYPIYAAALLIFIRCRTAGYDRRSLLDALTLTVGVGLLSWVFLILPYVHVAGLIWWQRAVAIAYPLGDVLVLALLARLLAPSSWRARSLQLLTLGTLGMLVSDVFFGLAQLHGGLRLGTATDLGWAVVYAAWGAAALHPSMTELTRPIPQRLTQGSRLRVALLLMAASLIAPAVLLAESVGKPVQDAGVIAVCSAVLYVLVLSRLADVAAAHRRALDRASVLRLAGASLAAAVTREQAAGAVRSGVRALLGPREERPAVLAVREGGVLRAVGAPPGEPPVPADVPVVMTENWPAVLTGPGPYLGPGRPGCRWRGQRAALPAGPAGPAVRRPADRGARRVRARPRAGRPVRHPGDPGPAGRAGRGAGGAEPGGDQAQQRGLLPDPGA